MPLRSALLVLTAASVTAAGVVALASRAPASLRHAEPGRAATDPALGTDFTEEQVARGRAYSRPGYVGFVVATLLEILLFAVLARGPWSRLVQRVETIPGGWLVHAAVLGALAALLLWSLTLPLAYMRGYVIEHAWSLSTQSVGGWLSDRARAVLVSSVVSGLTAVAFFAVVRWQPRTWWVWGWLSFSALTAVLVFVWPVAIAPLFNRFTPLQDAALERRVRALARAADVDVDEVLVADASRRTTAENAYVAGVGGTRRLVLYDTLLHAGAEDETLYVVGHELGHEVEHHVERNLFVAAGGLLIGFALLGWLGTRGELWSWAGAAGVDDLRAIPLLLLIASVITVGALPVQNAISRRFEARADEIALELTGDPATATRVLRRLALTNLADLRPPPAAVAVLYSHPPIPQRIRSAMASGREP
jgi:STE24 endopeptidase